jgi:adenylate cyclase
MTLFFEELKRRNVFRVGAIYVVTGWLLIQVAETIFPLFDYGDTPTRILVVVLAIGFVPALVLAWVFELTPDGLKRDADVDRSQSVAPQTGKQLDRLIMVVLALGIAYFAFDKFVLDPARDVELAESARQEGRSQALVKSYGANSIAVLAFDDMSPGGDQEYLSDGIAEELLNLLARIPELRVISRSSAFSFKGKGIALPEIAKQLNVAHILEGSVRKAGNRIRITAQLIDAHSDTHIWSESYDRELEDIFAIQDEIAAALVEKLEITLLKPAPLATRTDPEAYALYLQALYAWRGRSTEGHAEALALLQKAVVLDPSYANAWGLMSVIYAGEEKVRLMPLEEAAPLARRAARTALELDPANGIAHGTIAALALYVDRDLAAAARHAEAALASGRHDPETINNAGWIAKNLGRLDLAARIWEYGVSMDPNHVSHYWQLGVVNMYQERYEAAIDRLRTAIRLDPDYAKSYGILALELFSAGEIEEAWQVLEKEPWVAMRLMEEVIFHEAAGEREQSDQAMNALLHEARPGTVWVMFGYVFRGENEAALDWLEGNVDHIAIGWLAETLNLPALAEIQEHPRFQRVLHQMGISKEQLAAIPFNVKFDEHGRIVQ